MPPSRIFISAFFALSFSCGPTEAVPDAGSSIDASATADASSLVDAGSDAGPLDAGPLDAGETTSSSGGEGGIECDATGELSAGRTYCQARLGSVDVRFAEPIGGSGPLRLALYLHGDGARAYESGSALRVLLPFADEHHALIVAALAPNGCAWWLPPSHDCDASSGTPDTLHENAAALEAALTALRAAYDIADEPVFYYGSSGGSNFLTGSFFPRFGDRYPGVLAVNCGGEPPWDGALTWDADAAWPSELTFTYGDADFLREDAHSAVEYYEGLGFIVNETVLTGGVEHCAFDGHGRAAEVWSAYLER